jgi:hypothetical protein
VTFVLNAGADQSHRITASAIAVKPAISRTAMRVTNLAVVTLEDESPTAFRYTTSCAIRCLCAPWSRW